MKTARIAFVAVVLLLGVAVLAAQGGVISNTVQNVFVTNGLTAPVPTDTDNSAREELQFNVQFTVNAGGDSGSQTAYKVPAGKLLVIDGVGAGSESIIASEIMQQVNVADGDPSGAPLVSLDYYVSPVPTVNTGGVGLVDSRPARLCVEPGNTLVVTVVRYNVNPTGPTYGSVFINAHLIPLPPGWKPPVTRIVGSAHDASSGVPQSRHR